MNINLLNATAQLNNQLKEFIAHHSNRDTDQLLLTIQKLCEQGIPSPKHEEWKYFNTAKLLQNEYAISLPNLEHNTSNYEDLNVYKLDHSCTIVIVNGVYSSQLSNITCNGITVSNENNQDTHIVAYSEQDKQENPFLYLNDILSPEIITITITENIAATCPVHIIHITDNTSDVPCIINNSMYLHVEKHCTAYVLETYYTNSTNADCNNSVLYVNVSQDSVLDHTVLQTQNKSSVLFYSSKAHVYRDAIATSRIITSGSSNVRNTIHGLLMDNNATYNIYGAVSTTENAVVDNHTIVDHQKPHCESNELFKHLLADKSTAVFNGKIFVRKDAQKTNAYQSNRTILLSEDATINTKPQLEIYADDVKCSHGATSGSIDEQQLYYLQARGIPKNIALNLLTEAFIGEIISSIPFPTIAESLIQQSKVK